MRLRCWDRRDEKSRVAPMTESTAEVRKEPGAES